MELAIRRLIRQTTSAQPLEGLPKTDKSIFQRLGLGNGLVSPMVVSWQQVAERDPPKDTLARQRGSRARPQPRIHPPAYNCSGLPKTILERDLLQIEFDR